MSKARFTVITLIMPLIWILAFSPASRADSFIYANNYDGTPDNIWQIDITTGGTLTNQFAVPVQNGGGSNGRGVVDVNNILYVTTANSGNVFTFNTTTSAFATAFNVAGSGGLSSISFDGTNFWIGDYSGTNHAYLYSPTGTLLRTINLTNCTGFCDGLTFVPLNGGELISNRTDGFDQDSIYDIYNANTGALVQASFIDTTSLGAQGCLHTTGIAWDGTNYFVSCLDTRKSPTGSLAEYGPTGSFIGFVNLVNPSNFTNNGIGAAMEGLSANFAVTIQTPEPTTIPMLGLGLAVLGFLRKKLGA